jgi:hypothetical protein
VTKHGVALVFRQEFLVRYRTDRWRWLLVAWVGVIFLFTVLFEVGVNASLTHNRVDSAWAGERWQGIPLFGAQGLSAMLARSLTSALLSYVTVAALTLGTPLAFLLAVPLTTLSGSTRTDRVWFLLAPNPFVVLADSAPQVPLKRNPRTGYLEPPPTGDPLGDLGRGAREIRMSPKDKVAFYASYEDRREWPVGPVWPYGLAFNLFLGAGSVWITVRRLQTPVRSLAGGTRIA